MNNEIGVDVSDVFETVGLCGVQCTLTRSLAAALNELEDLSLEWFACVARDCLTGAREAIDEGCVAWVDLAPQRRAFVFRGLWVELRSGHGTLDLDLSDFDGVFKKAETYLKELLTEWEAVRDLGRVRVHDSQVLRKALE